MILVQFFSGELELFFFYILITVPNCITNNEAIVSTNYDVATQKL